MASVQPAVLQLLQKLMESILGSGSEGAAAGEEEEDRRDTQVVLGGAEETADLVHRELQAIMWGLEQLGGRWGAGKLCSGTVGTGHIQDCFQDSAQDQTLRTQHT